MVVLLKLRICRMLTIYISPFKFKVSNLSLASLIKQSVYKHFRFSLLGIECHITINRIRKSSPPQDSGPNIIRSNIKSGNRYISEI